MKIVPGRTCFVNTKLGPILTKTNVIHFMTKIELRLGMLVNTAPVSYQIHRIKILYIFSTQNSLLTTQLLGWVL